MGEEFKLDAESIKKQYESLIDSVESCIECVEINLDSETNISISSNSIESYNESFELEKKLKNCISADAAHFSMIGKEFALLDAELENDINEIIDGK